MRVCLINVMLGADLSKALDRYTSSRSASDLVKLMTMLAAQDPDDITLLCTESFRVFCFTPTIAKISFVEMSAKLLCDADARVREMALHAAVVMNQVGIEEHGKLISESTLVGQRKRRGWRYRICHLVYGKRVLTILPPVESILRSSSSEVLEWNPFLDSLNVQGSGEESVVFRSIKNATKFDAE
ncbi:unnamed protein product [Albugo candida]|uniref:Uncharacterized protein n=1 Tax=Albugo candida TaxID=65357 RepID=A0A024GSL2_9STRA|nr:unnamed protein product [Albugo candida]|eukprot:CCI49780.1 unnamed protein product [Albugo candida]